MLGTKPTADGKNSGRMTHFASLRKASRTRASAALRLLLTLANSARICTAATFILCIMISS